MVNMPTSLIKQVQYALFLIALWVTGCASTRLIESQVNAFAPRPVPPGSHYRFERLPSQQDSAAQEQLEAMAEAALAEVGFARDEANAAYSVQVSAIRRAQYVTLDRPALGWNLGWMMGNGGISIGTGALFPGLDAQTTYGYEVGLIVRERASQTVVFETRATHDGPWADSTQVLPALLQAALQGFPTPPAGVQRVPVEVPR